MSCVFSKADHVSDLIKELAQKYELSFYEPQNKNFIYN